jgi:hypothetical protein
MLENLQTKFTEIYIYHIEILNTSMYKQVMFAPQKFMKARKANRGTALIFLTSVLVLSGLLASRPGHSFPTKWTPVPNVQEVVWDQGPSGQVGNNSPHWDPTPDRPAVCKSLY